MAKKSTRREFLRGKAAARAVGDAVEKALLESTAGPPPEPSAAESYLVHVSRRAMACEFEVVLNAGQYEGGTEAALDALDLVELLEARMSVFRETSQISQVNREAFERPVQVEQGLFDLLELAVKLNQQTQGAFDVTSAPLWKAWGFARRSGAIPREEQLALALDRVGSRFLQLDPVAKTVRFLRPGMEISLGSIGKGYAVDRAADLLADAGLENFLIHGGQSSVVGRGHRWEPAAQSAGAQPGGWTVGIGHPLRPQERLAEVRLENRALGTSGSGRQFFRHQGRRYGHILDPRTGRPAERLLSATVLGPDATLADALATACYVMGPDEAIEFCRDRPELAAVLVCPVGRGPGVDVRSTGLEPEELVLLDPA